MNTPIVLKNLASFIDGQNDVLEKIMKGHPLSEALDSIARWVEGQSNGDFMVSILFVDANEKHLLHGAAPSLPEAYNKAIHGIELNPGLILRQPVAHHKKRLKIVIILSLSTLEQISDSQPSEHDLRACWSSPLISKEGRCWAHLQFITRNRENPHQRISVLLI